MSYIGNQPTQIAFVTDTFSGNGSNTSFSLSVSPAGTSSVLVMVSGVVQDPATYSVVGNTLTFSGVPPSGTSNISVRYMGIPASGVTTTAYRTITEFTAVGSTTTFTPPSYTVGFINVYRNGVRLGSADYTATNGTTVVLTSAAISGDLITIESFYVSSYLNAIPNTASSVTQLNLSNGIAGTGPAFSVYASADQSIPNNIQTVIGYDLKEFDTASRYNNTGSTVGGIPAYAFLPNVAGYYQVNWNVIVDAMATNTELLSRLFKNGANYAWSSNQAPSVNHYNSVVGSALVYLNGTTDYIQAAVFQNTGGALSTKNAAGNYRFSASLVRAA